MRQALGYLTFGLLLALSFAVAQVDLFVNIWEGLKNVFRALTGWAAPRRSAPLRFNVAAARRESYALGLPFPESDGTLSMPPEPPDQIWTDPYREGYAIADPHSPAVDYRSIAQFGVTSEEAMDAAYEALYGSMRDR